jgi:hypothetical protein
LWHPAAPLRPSLNIADPLAHDGTNTGRGRDKIPGASALKRSNLPSHGKLPFRMTLSIPIKSQLEGNGKTVLTRRVTIRWTTMTSMKRRESHHQKKTHRKKKKKGHQGEYPEKETKERWMDCQKRKEENRVVRRTTGSKGRHRQ